MNGTSPPISLILFAYRQEEYVHEAVSAALAQTYSPLEIILSDDCSPDRTFEIMQELADKYRGPHSIILNRNPANLGIAGHLRSIIKRATTPYLILAAGDDVSLPNRAETMAGVFSRHPNAMAVFCRCNQVNEQGEFLYSFGMSQQEKKFGWREVIRRGLFLQHGACFAYHRKCLDWPSELPLDGSYEDLILPLRAALLGEVHYVDQTLLHWRKIQSANRNEERLAIGDRANRETARKEAAEALHAAVQQGLISDSEKKWAIRILDCHRKREMAHANYRALPRNSFQAFWPWLSLKWIEARAYGLRFMAERSIEGRIGKGGAKRN